MAHSHEQARDQSRGRGWIARRLPAVLQGPGRARFVLLLAGVLALNSADTGTIGAAAAQLEADLGLSHAQLGLLATASSGVGAIAAVPMGVLADRVTRVRLLWLTVAAWGVAMFAGGLAPTYEWLLLSRLLLGAALAAAGPVVSSLTGDFVPPLERAGVLGWILGGEIIGAGFGLVVGAEVSAILSWRYAFFLLGAVSLALAFAVWRLLPEPPRVAVVRRAEGPDSDPRCRPSKPQDAQAAVEAAGVEPDPSRVLTSDPNQMSLLRAMIYLLRIPTNRLLIEASSIGYFFFAGLRTFVVIFVVRHFHISQTVFGALIPIIGIAGLIGTVCGGRITDHALANGHPSARILVPAVGYTSAAILFVPGVSLTSLAIALPLIALGAAALAAANPPLDAARLDIVPGLMWGRAESLRTVLRLAAEAAAPATFGWVADVFGGDNRHNADEGLRNAFLVMLIPLLANGLIMLAARRTYGIDVATAVASDLRASAPRP